MDPDGGNQHQLTHFNSLSIEPTVSPDGSKVAFTSFARGNPAIFILSTDTGRRLPFYNQVASMNATPDFTPDGKQLLYSSTASGWAQIYIANLDGSNLRRISSTRSLEVEPKVNPKTGTDVVFVSGRSGPQQIYRMNIDGTDVQRLTNGEGEASNPSWHPNGQTIAFSWTRGFATGNFNVFVMDVASRTYNQLTSGAGQEREPELGAGWQALGVHVDAGRVGTDLDDAGGRHAVEETDDGRAEFDAGVVQIGLCRAGRRVGARGRKISGGFSFMLNKRRISTIGLCVTLAMFAAGCKKKAPPPPPPPPPVQATPAPPPPAAPGVTSFTAEPTSIERGQSSTLSWTVSDATSVSIDNTIGAVQATGTRRVFPGASTTYTLTATGPGGTKTATATVNVTEPAPPPPPPAAAKATFEQLLSGTVVDAYFDYDKNDIREDARAALTKDADALKAIFSSFPDATVTIEGHCDDRGSAEYNLALGDRRATAAKEFLVQLGVPSDKLKTISYGKERPQCTDADESCWQKNRRAHFATGQ